MIKIYKVLQTVDVHGCEYQELGPDFKSYQEAVDYIKDLWEDWDTVDDYKIRCVTITDIEVRGDDLK